MSARQKSVADRGAWFVIFGLCLLVGIGARGSASAQNEPSARKLAFLVGVKTYDHGALRNLDFPENDVMELAEVLRAQQFEVVVLTTTLAKNDNTLDPTAENIRKRLTGLLEQRRVTKHDVILVGLAGHGMQPLGSKEAYFCPRDANPSTEGSTPTKPQTLIALGDILKQVDDSGVGHKLLLVDACRNDPNVRGRRGVERVDVSALPLQTGVLLSCAPGEFSFEHKSLGKGHGVFFYHVIEALRGAAQNRDNPAITWDGLRSYVKTRVPGTVRSLYGKDGGDQQPNDIGNLIGEPTVLAVAPISRARPEPKPEFDKPVSVSDEPESKRPANTGTVELVITEKQENLGTRRLYYRLGRNSKLVPLEGRSQSISLRFPVEFRYWTGQFTTQGTQKFAKEAVVQIVEPTRIELKLGQFGSTDEITSIWVHELRPLKSNMEGRPDFKDPGVREFIRRNGGNISPTASDADYERELNRLRTEGKVRLPTDPIGPSGK